MLSLKCNLFLFWCDCSRGLTPQTATGSLSCARFCAQIKPRVLDMCQYVGKPTRDQDVREKALTLSCLSYTSGFMKGVIAGSIAASKDGQPLVCPSEDVTPQQIASVVLKYLREHPEDRHEDALGLVYIALARTFPCKCPPSCPQTFPSTRFTKLRSKDLSQ